MVLLEICYIIYTILFGKGNGQNLSNSSLAKALFVSYCSNGTLHGTVFIVRSTNKACRIFWILVCLVAIFIGSFFSVSAVQEFIARPYENVVDITGKTVEGVQYPTVTICPMQMSDPWNFQRLVMNQVEPLDKASGNLQPWLIRDLKLFWEKLSSHVWISDDYMYNYIDNHDLTLSEAKLIFSQALDSHSRDFVPELFGGRFELTTKRSMDVANEVKLSAEWNRIEEFNSVTVDRPLSNDDVISIQVDDENGLMSCKQQIVWHLSFVI